MAATIEKVETVTQAARAAKAKFDAVKALRKECRTARIVAEVVLEVCEKIEAGLAGRPTPARVVGPLQSLHRGVLELDDLLTICRNKPVQAALFSQTYQRNLRSATSGIHDAMGLLGGARTGLSSQMQRQVEEARSELGMIVALTQNMRDERGVELRGVVSSVDGLVAALQREGLAADGADARRQIEELQSERDSLLRQKAFAEHEVMDAICALSLSELTCPLTLPRHPYRAPVSARGSTTVDVVDSRRRKEAERHGRKQRARERAEREQQQREEDERRWPCAELEGRERYYKDGLRKLHDNDTTLTDLRIDAYGIGVEGAAKLATALKRNTTLTTLCLTANDIGNEGAAKLATALKTNTTITTLLVSVNNIGDEGAAQLATVLETNTTLTLLNLWANNIDSEGAAKLATALKTNTTLAWLSLEKNKIGSEGAGKLATALEKNTTLTTLKLGQNKIGIRGAAKLATALERNTTLTTLDLKKNNIGDKGAAKFATAFALMSNITLTELNLQENKISNDGFAKLARVWK